MPAAIVTTTIYRRIWKEMMDGCVFRTYIDIYVILDKSAFNLCISEDDANYLEHYNLGLKERA